MVVQRINALPGGRRPDSFLFVSLISIACQSQRFLSEGKKDEILDGEQGEGMQTAGIRNARDAKEEVGGGGGERKIVLVSQFSAVVVVVVYYILYLLHRYMLAQRDTAPPTPYFPLPPLVSTRTCTSATIVHSYNFMCSKTAA